MYVYKLRRSAGGATTLASSSNTNGAEIMKVFEKKFQLRLMDGIRKFGSTFLDEFRSFN